MKKKFLRCAVLVEIGAILCCLGAVFHMQGNSLPVSASAESEEEDFIKWVDFDVSYEALNAAYEYDLETYGQDVHVEWIPLLAYTAVHTGGSFSKDALNMMKETKEKLCAKETTMEELTSGLKNYDYYLEAYDAVLHSYLGENGGTYGLQVFSPIAKGFQYNDYDDFGSSRDYGYSRPHLGHDVMGLIGTPVIAVESGTVEALGWNQYGGWRIGIRSDDTKRYYYYAHLRQDRPYAQGLKEGDRVKSGDVIGYMGHTGYSKKENVNNIDSVHLHFGIQLIFDESQEDGNGEIWIDCYNLTRFLSKNRSEVIRDDATKEWKHVETDDDAAKEQKRVLTDDDAAKERKGAEKEQSGEQAETEQNGERESAL